MFYFCKMKIWTKDVFCGPRRWNGMDRITRTFFPYFRGIWIFKIKIHSERHEISKNQSKDMRMWRFFFDPYYTIDGDPYYSTLGRRRTFNAKKKV